MKNVKTLLAVFAMAASTLGLHAQENPAGRKGANKEHHQQLKEDLKLSDEQAEAWSAVHKEYRPKIKAIRSEEGMSQEEKRAKGKALKAEMDAKLKSILSAEQAEKWDAMKAERQTKHRQGNRAERHEEMASKLGLSEKQKAAWMEIHEKYDAQKREIKEDDSLSDEARQKKMKAVRQQEKEAISNILSPAQLEQLKKLKEEQKEQRKMKKAQK